MEIAYGFIDVFPDIVDQPGKPVYHYSLNCNW